mgnify:FL=1
MRSRAVVTGVGLTAATGNDAKECWEGICTGRSGIRRNFLFDTKELLSEWAGLAQVEQCSQIDRCFALANTAICEALADSKLIIDQIDSDRIGLVIGSSLGAMPSLEQAHRNFLEKGILDAKMMAGSLIHCVADYLAEKLGLRGPRALMSNACAAGAIAVGYAIEQLWFGDADVVICGGVDPLTELSSHGFTCLGALDTEPCSPLSASSGLTLGEGAGFLILEKEENAKRRGATILAEISGYGTSCDGHHQTAPDPGGEGACRSMAAALEVARFIPEEIDYINLHGTGTPANDSVEPKAIRLLFKDSKIPPASSIKSALGHTLGAAGAVETVCCVLAIVNQVLPPTLGTRGLTSHSGLDIVPENSRHAELSVVLSNSFAFGGNNASVVVNKPGHRPDRDPVTYHRGVAITGLSGVVGTASSLKEIHQMLVSGTQCTRIENFNDGIQIPFGKVDLKTLSRRLNPSKVRRMDPMGILAGAVVADLMKSLGKQPRPLLEETGIIFATGYGPLSAVSSFNEGIIRQESAGGNALVFPNTVVNAAAGHLALLNRFRGYTATLACGGTSSVLAVQLASRVIARGGADRIVVVVADELPKLAVRATSQLPGYQGGTPGKPSRGAFLSEGAVAIMLEARNRAEERGAKILGIPRGFGGSGEPAGVAGLRSDGIAWSRSMLTALGQARVGAEDIVHVVRAASGHPVVDLAENRAIKRCGLAGAAQFKPKHTFGETWGCAAGLGLATILNDPITEPGDLVLVSSFAHGGSFASMVVEAA